MADAATRDLFVGIDFGTTNTVIAFAGAHGAPALAEFKGKLGACEQTWRSLLYFQPVASNFESSLFTGADAIAQYLAHDGEGRLLQSIKSHLASDTFSSTRIHNRNYKLEQLVAGFLLQARELVGTELGARAVVGRPVRYWGAESAEDDARAVERMRNALLGAGFSRVEFEFEPVAAAARYAERLAAPELVFIADFGGGTSDFTVIRVGPGCDPKDAGNILATGGIGIGGDTFDAQLIDHCISPELGKGTEYRNEFGKTTEIPASIFQKLQRWHHLSFLKSTEMKRLLERVELGALEPDKVARLFSVIEDNLGLHLHQAVTRAKLTLSSEQAARVQLRVAGLAIDREVTRAEFTSWIADDLERMHEVIDTVLEAAGVGAEKIDKVFATGGSAFVPAVRHMLCERFGESKLEGGDELTSVAWGLAEGARIRFAHA